jgi:hypothetical protein
MSVCAVPAKRRKGTFSAPTPTTLSPPAQKYEFCEGGTTTTVPTGPGLPINTVVCCPQPGPAGPPGPAGDGVGSGMKYSGVWTTGTEYYFEGGVPSQTNLVKYKDVMYICIVSHIADDTTEPGLGANWETNWEVFGEVRRLRWMGDWADNFQYYPSDVVRSMDGSLYVSKTTLNSDANANEPGFGVDWETQWDLLNTAGGGLSNPADQNFFDQLKNNVFDWMKTATVGDWLGALAIGAGVIWAGSMIVDAITGNGGGDGHADSRYNGSPAYTGTITSPTLPVIVASLMEFAGFASSAYDVSMLPSTALNFTVSGTVNVRAVLNQLALAYQFDIITSGSTVKFIPKYQSTIRALTSDDLGHVKDSTTGGVKYAAKRMQGIDLPRSVTLKYYSQAIDQNIFTQTSTLETYTEGQDTSIEVPFTMTDAQAKTITETVLINSHIEQQQYSFTTDYHNIDLEPSDVITIPLDTGGTTQVRIIEINETDDGLLEFTTTRSDYNSYSYVSSGAGATVPPNQPSQVVTSLGYSQALFLEVPPLNDNDGTSPRIKALIHGYARAGWTGADVYRSTDGGNSYSSFATGSSLSTFGLVATAVSAPSDYRIWDTTTSISVTVKQGTLLSAASDLAVQNGANWCMVGEEVIGFVNATLTGTSGGLNVYTISRLLRGRAGSESKCTTHQANELFVLLDSTLVDISLANTDLGKTVKTKTVTIGSDISKVTAVDLNPFGQNMRPWAPALVKAVRQPNNDWIITWKERPRINNSLRDYTEIAHDADYAGFAWAILSGGVVKNKGTTTDTTYTYTAAQQVTDFGSIQSSITGSITQMSTIVGGGYPGVF